MSSVKLQGNAGGTGSITIASPNTNSNRTLSLPDSDGSFVTADSSGNVGIGTSSPSRKLVVSYAGAQGFEFGAGVGVSSGNELLNYNRSTSLYIPSAVYASTHTFYAGTAGGTRAVDIDSSGNMLVGKTSLGTGNTAKITAEGRYATWNTGSSSWMFGVNGTAYTWSDISSGSEVERARIDSSGNLLVGTTSNISSAPIIAAQQTSSTVNACFGANAASSSYVYNIVDLTTGTASGTGFNFLKCRVSNYGTTVLQILGNGNVQNANNSYGSTSDIKLKENVIDATPKLAQLNQVRVVNYNFIGDAQKQIGVIAQELEQIFPGMVEDIPDRDEKGNDLGTTTKSVKYSVFVPMLIKAIQELNEKVEAQAAEIKILKEAKA